MFSFIFDLASRFTTLFMFEWNFLTLKTEKKIENEAAAWRRRKLPRFRTSNWKLFDCLISDKHISLEAFMHLNQKFQCLVGKRGHGHFPLFLLFSSDEIIWRVAFFKLHLQEQIYQNLFLFVLSLTKHENYQKEFLFLLFFTTFSPFPFRSLNSSPEKRFALFGGLSLQIVWSIQQLLKNWDNTTKTRLNYLNKLDYKYGQFSLSCYK